LYLFPCFFFLPRLGSRLACDHHAHFYGGLPTYFFLSRFRFLFPTTAPFIETSFIYQTIVRGTTRRRSFSILRALSPPFQPSNSPDRLLSSLRVRTSPNYDIGSGFFFCLNFPPLVPFGCAILLVRQSLKPPLLSYCRAPFFGISFTGHFFPFHRPDILQKGFMLCSLESRSRPSSSLSRPYTYHILISAFRCLNPLDDIRKQNSIVIFLFLAISNNVYPILE